MSPMPPGGVVLQGCVTAATIKNLRMLVSIA